MGLMGTDRKKQEAALKSCLLPKYEFRNLVNRSLFFQNRRELIGDCLLEPAFSICRVKSS